MTAPALTPWRLIRVHFAWVPILPLFFTLLMGWAAGDTDYLSERLARDGIDTTAEVLRLSRSEQRRDNSPVQYTHHATVRFTALDGTERTETLDVSLSYYDRARVGQIVPLRMVPDEPRALELEPGTTGRSSWVFGIGAAVFLLATLGSAYVVYADMPSMLRAARRGQARQARVTGMTDTGWKVSDDSLWRLEWTDETGLRGESRRRRRAALPGIGDTITVHHDPRDNRTWWVGDF